MSKKNTQPKSDFISLSELMGDIIISVDTPEMLGEEAYSSFVWAVNNSRRPSTYISKLKSIAKKKAISDPEAGMILNHVHLYESLDSETRRDALLSIQHAHQSMNDNEFNRYITNVLATVPETALETKSNTHNEKDDDKMTKQTGFGQYSTDTKKKDKNKGKKKDKNKEVPMANPAVELDTTTSPSLESDLTAEERAAKLIEEAEDIGRAENKFERPEGQAILFLHDFMQDVTSYEDFVLKLEDERKLINKMYKKLLNRKDVTDLSIDIVTAVFGLLKYNQETTRELVMALKVMSSLDHEKFWDTFFKFLENETPESAETVDKLDVVENTIEEVEEKLDDVKNVLSEITIDIDTNARPEDLDLYNLTDAELKAYVRKGILKIGQTYLSKVNGVTYTMTLKYKGVGSFEFRLNDKVA